MANNVCEPRGFRDAPWKNYLSVRSSCLDLEGRRYWPIKKNCAAWAQILSEGEIFLVSSQLF